MLFNQQAECTLGQHFYGTIHGQYVQAENVYQEWFAIFRYYRKHL